jgi:PelA/Pel-15E family pectate lyase
MEAYETMVWIQDPGTVGMAHTFLDAYDLTGDPYYYQAAEQTISALIWGQSVHGGWNYMIDFAGDRSLKQWYATIGKNGWRLEEFHHYYGNDTFDDLTTADAARVIMRMYMKHLDPRYKPAIDKAIEFILKSQYPIGGWPQRYPLRYDNYTHYYTFNDDVVWQNVLFLLQCYETLGENRLLDPILRGMNFYLITQHSSGGWGMQYDMNLQPAGARSYEPKALLPQYTENHVELLMMFYELTGDRRFMDAVPKAIDWLESTAIAGSRKADGSTLHPTFIEIDTNRSLYVHRKGSNVIHGSYWYDYDDKNLLGHYGPRRTLNIPKLRAEYERLNALTPDQASANSPLRPARYDGSSSPQQEFMVNRGAASSTPDINEVREIVESLDDQGRWLVRHLQTSNPYIGDGVLTEQTMNYVSTHVGDKTDTSPFRDESDQLYISTGRYIENMRVLMNYIRAQHK